MNHRVTFLDGYWYCYANSAAMLLSSIAEKVSPHLIEVLTGVGLGAFIADEPPHLPFFSGLAGLPDKGVTHALTLLGFSFEEQAVTDQNAPPFVWLEETLRGSPVLVGPLDMHFLSYNPGRPSGLGVDHYVLVYRIDGDQVFVLDPAGYAEVSLARGELTDAWRADAINYKRAHFRSWSSPRRSANPTLEEIRSKAMMSFKCIYAQAEQLAATKTRPAGEAAIHWLADAVVAEEISPAQSGHLRHFALPLGVKRARDFAVFLEPAHPALAQLKWDQAALFGSAQTNLMRGNHAEAAEDLKCLADIEEQVRLAVQER